LAYKPGPDPLPTEAAVQRVVARTDGHREAVRRNAAMFKDARGEDRVLISLGPCGQNFSHVGGAITASG